eukprot:371928-Rhodomonas_salina.1
MACPKHNLIALGHTRPTQAHVRDGNCDQGLQVPGRQSRAQCAGMQQLRPTAKCARQLIKNKLATTVRHPMIPSYQLERHRKGRGPILGPPGQL